MMKQNVSLPGQRDVRAIFDQVAGRYDQHAALEREVGSRLFERLSFRRREPARIVDLGSGTGHGTKALKRQFRKAEVIAVDASLEMCRRVRRQSGFLHPVRPVCADLSALPVANRSVDLLFSNLAIQWCENIRATLAGFRRVLSPGGLLLFSSLGPDSMKEMKVAAGTAGNPLLARQFTDMHNLGDALVEAGFSEPVMDSEFITTEYPDLQALVTEMALTGAGTHIADWAARISAGKVLADAYAPFVRNGRYPVTWEIVYGAAFGPQEGQPVKSREGDVATFSVDFLRASRPRR
jgi:malonyl-CoA O-methyltransferase